MSKTVEELKAELAALEPTSVTGTTQPEPTPAQQNSADLKACNEYCAWNSRTYGTKNPTFAEWQATRAMLRKLDAGEYTIVNGQIQFDSGESTGKGIKATIEQFMQ